MTEPRQTFADEVELRVPGPSHTLTSPDFGREINLEERLETIPQREYNEGNEDESRLSASGEKDVHVAYN